MDPLRIMYVGPTHDISGYANAARNHISALDREGHDVAVRVFQCDSYHRAPETRLAELEAKTTEHFDVMIQHCTPELHGRFIPSGHQWKKHIACFAWETDRIVWKVWVDNLNKADAIVVPCNDNIAALRRSGITRPIYKVPHYFDTGVYDNVYSPLDLDVEHYRARYYSIFHNTHKKGFDKLVTSFCAAFARNPDDAVLIIRTYTDPFRRSSDEKDTLNKQLDRLRSRVKLQRYPKIRIIHDPMSDEEVMRFHNTMDCFVLPTRGEGWCIPAFDAMAFGKMPIVTRWGGLSEFIDDTTGLPLRYELEPCQGMANQAVYTGFENWAEPSAQHLVQRFRESFALLTSEGAADVRSTYRRNGLERAKSFDINNSQWTPVLEEVINSDGRAEDDSRAEGESNDQHGSSAEGVHEEGAQT